MQALHLLKIENTYPRTHHIPEDLNCLYVITYYEKAYDKQSRPGKAMDSSHRRKYTNTCNKNNTTFILQLKDCISYAMGKFQMYQDQHRNKTRKWSVPNCD
jgi:hypothetical protein